MKKEAPNENNRSLYLHLILGSVGIILIALGIFEFLAIVQSTSAYLMTLLGFIIIAHYIYFLEKKVGISIKLIWIRAVILISMLVSIYYVFYN